MTSSTRPGVGTRQPGIAGDEAPGDADCRCADAGAREQARNREKNTISLTARVTILSWGTTEQHKQALRKILINLHYLKNT